MESHNKSAIRFGRQIIKLRNDLGISQEELAFRSELSRTYIGCIERGEKNPTIVTIEKLAKGLNITKSKLMDYE